MSLAEPDDRPGLIARVLRLLIRPASAWDEIETEAGDAASLFRTYVAPLALIPAVCAAVGQIVFPLEMLDVRYRSPLVIILAEAVVSYLLVFVQVFVMGAAIDLLAPLFGAVRNRLLALRLAVYSATPIWISGVAMLWPSIGWLLMILGAIYGLYLLYVGLPRLMKPGPERRLPYYAVVLITFMILGIVGGSVLSHVRDLGGPIRISIAAPNLHD